MKTNRGAIDLGKFFQSAKEGAKKIGISPSQFSLLLSGKRMPSIEIAAKIENEWGIPCKFWTELITNSKDRSKKVK